LHGSITAGQLVRDKTVCFCQGNYKGHKRSDLLALTSVEYQDELLLITYQLPEAAWLLCCTGNKPG